MTRRGSDSLAPVHPTPPCAFPGSLRAQFLLPAEQPALRPSLSAPTSPGEGRVPGLPRVSALPGARWLPWHQGASREGAAPRPAGSGVTGSLCQQTEAGCMFCPTSALTGGGVRSVLPSPPPRSRGSLLPPSPQLLRGLSQRLRAGGRPQRLQETGARPACRHDNAARLVPPGG